MKGTVAELLRREAPTVPPDAKLGDLVDLLLANPEARAVYVVGPDRMLLGVVSFRSVLRAANARMTSPPAGPLHLVRWWRDVAADDIRRFMREPAPVSPETLLADALRVLEVHRENDLPVTDASGRLVGELSGTDVLRAVRDAVRAGD